MVQSRFGIVCGVLAAAFGLQTWLHARADGPVQILPVLPAKVMAQPAAVEKEKGEFSDRVTLPTDRNAEKKLDIAKDMLKPEKDEWGQAVQLLQSILDSKEDAFLRQADEKGRRVSIRAEANRVIGAMPKEGLEFYELQYGAAAKTLLQQGIKAANPQVFAEVALRFMHTEAGTEASVLLGTYHLDEGRYVVASLCFKRLLEREGVLDKLPLVSLFKAALAFERAGDAASRDRVWSKLVARFNRNELPVGLRRMNVNELKAALGKKQTETTGAASRFDWPLYQGSVDRAAFGDGGAPFLINRWVYPNNRENQNFASVQTKAHLERAINQQKGKGPILTAFHPIVAGGKIIFRSYWGVHALDVKKGTLAWEAQSNWSLDKVVLEMPRMGPNVESTVNTYFISGSHALLYNNSMLGTLSTDNTRVFLVEDTALPPQAMHPGNWGRPMNVGSESNRWTAHNFLAAYDLENGKLLWELGTEKADESFADTFFLGPPLPLGEKLYVLAEVSGEIRLLCLDPSQGTLVWSQTLCLVKQKLLDEPARRTQAALLSYGDGILVCPTNAGVVLGLDLLTRSLVWAYSYQEGGDTSHSDPMVIRGRGMRYEPRKSSETWEVTAPIIQEGKVVFTAPDGLSVHCLNLADGAAIWNKPRENDHYLAAVHRGKVILVGKEMIRARRLDNGEDVWKTATGMPSGRGIANADTYFLPLKTGEVWAISLETSKVLGKSTSPKSEVPGNLIFHDGDVLSQSPLAVVAYPQLAVKEREISAKLEKNRNDPSGLTERGELRLHQGQLEGAVADLRLALNSQPPPAVEAKARLKLYEALGELLDRNFAANERFLKEYESLVTIPAPPNEVLEDRGRREEEQLNRRAHYLRLIARGREGQGRLSEALQAYLDFANLSVKELISAPDEPGLRIRADVWAQGRIADMVKKATSAQRQALDQAVNEHWKKVETSKDMETLRRFAGIFGVTSSQGRAAQLKLAERMAAENRFLDAEELLQGIFRLRGQKDVEAASIAIVAERLAQLMLRRGLLEDAAYFYRILNRDYAQVVVRDGKTGAQLYHEACTDKRLLPYIDEPRRSWLETKNVHVQMVRSNTGFPARSLLFLEPEGEVLPFFQRRRLGIHNFQQVQLIEKSTGEVRDSFQLHGLPVQPALTRLSKVAYRPQGHFVAFSWGHYAYGYDPVSQKELWKVNLLGNQDAMTGLAAGMVTNLMPAPDGGFILAYQHSDQERIGSLRLLGSTCACFVVKEEGLRAVDPLTGRTRWVRSGIAPGSEIFGDDQYVFVLPRLRNENWGAGIALRASDGMPVAVPDFVPLYRKKLQVIGRHLLLKDVAANQSTLRLYDVQAGVDIWAKSLPQGAVLLTSQDPKLTGMVDAAGNVVVWDVQTGADVLKASVDPAQLGGQTPEVHLVMDEINAYVLFNFPAMKMRRTVSSSGAQLRSIEVNGPVYAFDRGTGKLNWRQTAANQQLVLDEFGDNPLLIFTVPGVLTSPPVPVPGINRARIPPTRPTTTVLVLDKLDGRQIYPGSGDPEELVGVMPFHSLLIDRRSRTMELQSYQSKLVVHLDHEATQAGAAAEPKGQPALPEPEKKPAQPKPKVALPGKAPLQLQLQLQLLKQTQQLGKEMEALKKALQDAEPPARPPLKK